MKLNTYKNQHEIDKTFEVETYDLMYGTVEDILEVLDSVGDGGTWEDNKALLNAVTANRSKLNDLLLDVFPDMTRDDLKRIKVKDLIPLFMELFAFVGESLTGGRSKN